MVLTLLAALAVGLALNRLKIPGGMMIGAAIGACALNLSAGAAPMPSHFKTLAQIIVGAFIGAGISQEELRRMHRALKPGAVVLLGLLAVNILSGCLIHRLTSMDLLTALLSSTPGGISDMPIVAADMGADASKVLVLQFIRFVVGIGIFPMVIGKLTRQEEGPGAGRTGREQRKGWEAGPILVTLAAAAAAGLAGKASGVPAGTLAFATAGSILLKLVYPRAGIPRSIRKGAQWISGAFVGAGIGMEQLRELARLPVPALILLVSMAAGTGITGLLLRRMKCFTLREGMLAATPGGASDMALISADLGVSNMNLILIHVLRAVVVVTFFPSLLQLAARWLG